MSSPEVRPNPRVTRRLVVVCVLASVVVAALYPITIGTRTGQLLSELALGGRPATEASVVAAERVLALFSRLSVVLGLVFLVVVALLQRRPRLAAVAAATVIGANLTTQLLKVVILDRADLLDGSFYVLPNSFPSGHATAAASIAVALLLVLPPLLRAPSVIISAVVVGIVAASTLVAGWHRMADAVGGVFVATAWAAGLAAILSQWRGVDIVGRRTEAFGRILSILPVIIGVVCAALGIAAYLVVAADPLDVLAYLAERGGSQAVFWVAVLITIGASLLSLGILGLALRDIRLDPRTAPSGEPARPTAPIEDAPPETTPSE